MTGSKALVLTATAILLAGIAVAMVFGRGGDPPVVVASAPVSTGTTPPPTSQAAPASTPRGIVGYRVSPVGQRSYRLSLAFRLRNTIINGLSAPGSDYSVTTDAVRRGSLSALLFGVGAAPGASPPGIPGEIAALIGLAPTTRERVDGLAVSIFRAPQYGIGLVDAGPRRAVVVIAPDAREALTLGRAVARAIARE